MKYFALMHLHRKTQVTKIINSNYDIKLILNKYDNLLNLVKVQKKAFEENIFRRVYLLTQSLCLVIGLLATGTN